MKKFKSLKNDFQYYIILSFVKLIRSLPRRTGIAMAKNLALLFYSLSGKHRQNTINHLTIAFGNEKTKKEIREIARNVFLHFAAAGVDTIRIPLFLREEFDRYVKVDNLHHMEQAVQKGNGVILLTGHFGNWELLGAYLTWKNYPLRVLGTALANPKLNQLIKGTRLQAGSINIERGKETWAMVKALKKGYPLGILMDQDTKVKGVFVDFFGKKANTPVGPILLARRLNVPVLPVFIHLEEDLTYHVEFDEPFVFADTGDSERDLIEDVRNCSRIYEQVIRRHPEQWVWMHRRWKRRPVIEAGT